MFYGTGSESRCSGKLKICICKARLGRTITLTYDCNFPSGIFLKNIYVQVHSSIDRTAVPFSQQQSTTKVALVKATKHKANPATDEVRVENRNHGLA